MCGGRLLIIPLYLTRYDLGVWRRFVHFGTISDNAFPTQVRTWHQMVSTASLTANICNRLTVSAKPARLSDALMAVMRELFLGIGMRPEKTNTG